MECDFYGCSGKVQMKFFMIFIIDSSYDTHIFFVIFYLTFNIKGILALLLLLGVLMGPLRTSGLELVIVYFLHSENFVLCNPIR